MAALKRWLLLAMIGVCAGAPIQARAFDLNGASGPLIEEPDPFPFPIPPPPPDPNPTGPGSGGDGVMDSGV